MQTHRHTHTLLHVHKMGIPIHVHKMGIPIHVHKMGIPIQTVLSLVGTGLYNNATAKTCLLLPWQLLHVAMAVWGVDNPEGFTTSPGAII